MTSAGGTRAVVICSAAPAGSVPRTRPRPGVGAPLPSPWWARDPDLAVPACLLLVLALGLGLRGDRLSVGDADLLGVHLDAELACEPLGDDREVGLAHPREQGLLRLVVAAHAQRRIFVL